jgi:hypothetical protein
MRIFLCELKKLWNLRIIAVIAALGVLVWFAVLADWISGYDSLTTHGGYGKYQTEMFDLYGDTLSPAELADYDIPGKIAEAHAEADAIIAAEPIFEKYGISDFEEYLENRDDTTVVVIDNVAVMTMRNGKMLSEDEYYALDALLTGGEGATIDEWYESPAMRANSLNSLQIRYAEYYNDDNLDFVVQNDLRPVVVRAAEKIKRMDNANLIREDLCEGFSSYAAVVGVFAILAVMFFVAPLVANDRIRKLHLLQYSSAVGRKIFRLQFAATAVSAAVLSLVIIAAGYAPYLSAAWEYRNAHIMAYDVFGMWLYNITFGQYLLILAAMSLAVSIGAACLMFVLARFSSNIVTLMIKAVPVCAACAAVCGIAIYYALSFNNVIFNYGFRGRVDAPEAIVCGAVLIIGVIAAVIVMVREKRVDAA